MPSPRSDNSLVERMLAPPEPQLIPPREADLLAEEVACVTRELAFRRAVYRRRVTEKKMSAEKAQHEINVMQRVLARLHKMERSLR